jgi:hypothetical protein
VADRIPDSEFIIFGHSSHLTILYEDGDAYLDVSGVPFYRRGVLAACPDRLVERLGVNVAALERCLRELVEDRSGRCMDHPIAA